MRNGIKDTVRRILGDEKNWNITFGYDCIGIEYSKNKTITVYDIDEFKDAFETELVWININKRGNFLIGVDISAIISQAFGGNWQEYENEYEWG